MLRSFIDIFDEVFDEMVVDAGRKLKSSINGESDLLLSHMKASAGTLDEVITLETLMGPKRRGRTKRLLKLRDMERKLASVQATMGEMLDDPDGKPRNRRGRRPKPKLCLVDGCNRPLVDNGMCKMHLEIYEKAKQEISPKVIRRRPVRENK
ncbi:MAG: hypothetical protein GXP49_05940 [Deltaproteobacteria bacterium]|nr:hypothetical protein [Deltaproteobacteria bacterium]